MHNQQVYNLLNDPNQIEKRNEEINKTFELANLTLNEKILVMDKINNHAALNAALEKLKPFIKT